MDKKTMLDYVAEATAMMQENIKNGKELTSELVGEYISGGYKDIWIVASGSSHNGAACARLFIQQCLGCQVKLITPFQFVHAEHDVPDCDMVIAISQSGYSKNTMEALRVMRSLGRKAIALTGDLESDIREDSDLLIDFGVGLETVGYVTKGVNALALFLMLFSLEAAWKKHILTEQEYESIQKELEKVPVAHKQVREAFPDFFEKNLAVLTAMQNAYVCACGANIGTAMEGALKIGETVQVPGIWYELEEYIHGPNLQLTPNYTVFFIDGGCASDRVDEIFYYTRIVTDRSILVTNRKEYMGEGVFCVPFEIREDLTPLCFLPFFQMLSFEVTQRLHRWEKHPLQLLMKEKVAAKSANYDKSPLRIDMPG